MGTATITHHVVGQGGKYIAHLEGEDAKGTLEWEPGDEVDGKEVRIATHTLVPEAIGGSGVAASWVEGGADHGPFWAVFCVIAQAVMFAYSIVRFPKPHLL